MAQTIKLTATDGTPVEFVDEVIGSGAMKDVYFSPDKSYVVGFFRTPQDANAKDRLQNIVGKYRDKIFGQIGGDYWENLFCWPTKLVECNGKLGIVCPAYQKHFFFKDGMFKGKEKEGKWFASAKLRNKFLKPDQKGTWLTHYHMCLQIARAVRRLHAAGLAHSDLSYKNVLVDPESGRAAVIDCDGLVVPGKYPPDVVGTPDFIAPEVLQTRALKVGDPNKKLPSIQTDRHALAVLIYMYLLNRHPLRGGKVNDLDAAKDEELSMGAKALFVEHPTDKSNRPKIKNLAPSELPQGDVEKLPYTICGPYLKELFDRAFIDGLHDPMKRPTADEWENALVKTTDLMQPCQNPNCEAHWFVFDNSTKPKCPFCGTEYHGQLPSSSLFSISTIPLQRESSSLRTIVLWSMTSSRFTCGMSTVSSLPMSAQNRKTRNPSETSISTMENGYSSTAASPTCGTLQSSRSAKSKLVNMSNLPTDVKYFSLERMEAALL